MQPTPSVHRFVARTFLCGALLLGWNARAQAQAFTDLGQGLAGSAGVPVLSGEGTLIGGTNYSLALSSAAPNSSAFLIFGASALNLPILGGVLVPSPDAIAGPVNTSATGTLAGNFKWPQAMLPGVKGYWQVWIADSGAPGGLAASNALESNTPTQLGGVFPHDWIYGGSCGTDPQIQVHRYNQDTYILRQSMCTNFEGPFMYLLFGQDKVLMVDTGAGGIPIAATVYQIIQSWLLEQSKPSIQLVVAHSHSHGDHIQGDSQFNGQPNTVVVGTSPTQVANFFGFSSPTAVVTYDLGGRVLDLMEIPGHQAAHIALYDRNTALLLTGDSLYPGFIFLSASTWNTYRDSISRLRDFIEPRPIAWVLGGHVEMKSTPFQAYPYGTKNQPEERDLQLEKKHLQELDDALNLLPTAVTELHADFIING